MTTGSELFGWGEPAARGGGQGAAGGPDFVRNDRGDADDHWSHAVGEQCSRCGAELGAGDYVRRREDGGWVHESCPPTAPGGDADEASAAE
ncbi:MAG TPA: hypothetical protein VFJ17_08315 [Mycobacteriales bacterium]|jgi:hypothetical protein|nr:hypothetical protein [Mycobacteriales bacterium]